MKKMVAISLLAVCSAGMSINAMAKEDQFADVDCSKEQESMLGMKVCAGRELQKTEKLLEAQRSKFLKSADGNMKKAMRTWFKAADALTEAKCEVEGLRYEGGSMQTLVEGTCRDSEYKDQLKALKEYENRPEGS